MRQVAVEETEVEVAVPGDRGAVADAAEQEAEGHPVLVGKGRVREVFVQADEPAAPAMIQVAPAQPVEELVEPPHAPEYSREPRPPGVSWRRRPPGCCRPCAAGPISRGSRAAPGPARGCRPRR